ncbi:PAS domain S-box protein [Halovenus salina]|nr:PAS domain S-box protein [Halovenus salina]
MSEATEPSSLTEMPEVSVTTIMESIPDAVIVAEFGSNEIVAVNDAATELFDCRTDDLIGADRRTLHPTDNIDAYREAFHRGLNGDKVERLQDGSPVYIETWDGKRVPVEINAQRIEANNRTLVLGVFRDISTRIDRENQLKEATARLNTLVDATPFPVAVLDPEGTVQLWNQAAEETFGYGAEEIVGTQYPLFVDDEQFQSLFERVLDGGTVGGCEAVHRARDGSRLDVELYARPLYEDGEITGSIGSAIDITDRKRRNQQLDVLHRLLRHNLRNKLTIIQGYASMLQSGESVDNAAREDAVEKILAATAELSDLSTHAVQSRTLSSAAGSARTDLSTLLANLRETDAAVSEATVEVPTVEAQAVVSKQAVDALSRLLTRIVEYIETPTIDLAVEIRDRYVQLDIHGETALLAGGDAELIRNGTETDLRHGSDLDVARTYLAVTGVGGDIIPLDSASGPRSLRVEIPRLEAESSD